MPNTLSPAPHRSPRKPTTARSEKRSKRGVLAPEEVQALLAEYHSTRDLRLRNHLVAHHEALVRHLVNRIASAGGHSVDDLMQVGYMGLIGAIDRFDPTSGYRFITFATPTILGVIKRYLRDHGWLVKGPRKVLELGMRLRKTRAALEQQLGRTPTVAEMAAAAGVTEEQILEAMEMRGVYQPASLDALRREEDGGRSSSLAELVGQDDPALAGVEQRESVRRAVERLEERQRRVVYYRFFENQSQTEVARRLGCSQMQVSRLERQALQHLRTELA